MIIVFKCFGRKLVFVVYIGVGVYKYVCIRIFFLGLRFVLFSEGVFGDFSFIFILMKFMLEEVIVSWIFLKKK